ncbi:TPA: cytidine/deoxycytidylate deaminase family protein [archaeon]|nr:cytidine/deoxycytidylate deaminase family protein [Candidatus Undinarchaeales archaeon SRR5007147.bin71]
MEKEAPHYSLPNEEAEKNRTSWDTYFVDITNLVKERSTCNRAKVGAILVKNRRIISTGYNGAAKGTKHCSEVGCNVIKAGENPENLRDHCSRTIHAEQNAIIQAALFGVAIEGATLYCTHTPCYTCAKMIANAGVKEVIYMKTYDDKDSLAAFEEAGIKLREYQA